MKIAIINLTGGGMSSGYMKYLSNVLPRLALHEDVEHVFCVLPSRVNIPLLDSALSKITIIEGKPYNPLRRSPDKLLMAKLIDFAPDIIFIPTERFLKFDDTPVVNMIQNMEPFVRGIDGNGFRETVRQWVQYMDGKVTLRKADRVIAISRFVKDTLMRVCGIPEEKIGLVYHGIDSRLADAKTRPTQIPNDWKGNFLFTAGSVRPARGLEDVLSALQRVIAKTQTVKGLVIAGEAVGKMMAYKKKLDSWIKKAGIEKKICWAGKLNTDEMTWCFQNCTMFVMTSRVEACPNIVLEAMANGCACISTETQPMPEFFGEAAIYYPPKNGKALSKTIQTVLNWDDNKRSEMSAKARRRASDFSWDICAEKTVAELKKAIETYRINN